MGRIFTVMFVLATALSLTVAGPSRATVVEPYSFCLGNSVYSWDVESSEPQVRDTIHFFGTGALVQHSIVINRVFHPATMRGSVSGTLGATGPANHGGDLHGVITPEGMRGTIQMTRYREDGRTDKFVGRWTSRGHPDGPSSDYSFCFEGRFIVST